MGFEIADNTFGTESSPAFNQRLRQPDRSIEGLQTEARTLHMQADICLQRQQISKTTGIEKSVKYNEANSEKKKSRLDWTKHRWQKFQNQWVGKHGRAAVKEMRRDANVKPSGQSWTSAPGNKQPFRVLHSSIRAPPSPMTSAPPSSPRNR